MILVGDSRELMAGMPEASVHAIVTDPPYGLEFMGKDWDKLDGDDQPGYAERPRFSPRDRASAIHGKLPNYYMAGEKAQRWHEAWAREALRVLKPGGHLVAFGGTRTHHRLFCALEDAGFQIRDTLMWLYGQGYPKSRDVSKAIDKAAGASRRVLAERPAHTASARWREMEGREDRLKPPPVSAPATEAAIAWQGWGTALKPGHEPIALARKPFEGTVERNVQDHGTGAVNVDGCRIVGTKPDKSPMESDERSNPILHTKSATGSGETSEGRWPANVVLTHDGRCVELGAHLVTTATGTRAGRPAGAGIYGSGFPRAGGGATGYGEGGIETTPLWACVPGCPARLLDDQSGQGQDGVATKRNMRGKARPATVPLAPARYPEDAEDHGYGGFGGASRFFYTAKATASERALYAEAPMFGQPEVRNHHLTVKPVALMRWLVRLITPPGGLVLDPFAGSGTTGVACALEGFRYLGIDRELEYAVTGRARRQRVLREAAKVEEAFG